MALAFLGLDDTCDLAAGYFVNLALTLGNSSSSPPVPDWLIGDAVLWLALTLALPWIIGRVRHVNDGKMLAILLLLAVGTWFSAGITWVVALFISLTSQNTKKHHTKGTSDDANKKGRSGRRYLRSRFRYLARPARKGRTWVGTLVVFVNQADLEFRAVTKVVGSHPAERNCYVLLGMNGPEDIGQ